jgi:hypothetical protein
MFGTGTESLVFWALLLSNLYEREKKKMGSSGKINIFSLVP